MDHKKCFLCLEIKSESIIFADEKDKVDIRDITLQHCNWPAILNGDDFRIICNECWQAIWTFHQFYIKVEKAHKLLQETNSDNIKLEKSASNNFETLLLKEIEDGDILDCKEKDDILDIRIEEIHWDESAIDVLALHKEETNKNGRRKTKRCKSKKNCENSPLTEEKEKKTPLTGIRRRRGRPKKQIPPVDPTNQTSKDVIVKSEVENTSSNDVSSTPKVGAINHSNSNSEIPENKSKVKYVARKNLSIEYDKFIAKHFKLNCCLCQKVLKDFDELKSHFRSVHKMSGYVLCCNKKLLKRGILVDHIHTHQNPDYFKCLKCQKVLADRRCLELHKQVHDEKGKPEYKCDKCSKSFHKRVVYLRHMQNHVPEEMKQFECRECSKKFATNYLMNQHLKVTHMRAYSKICDICGKKITGREALKRHQELHENIIRSPIQCKICGITLTTKYGLSRHMGVIHTKELQIPHKCPYPECSKISPNELAHKRHIKYTHTLERCHNCPLCEKSFKLFKSLREHLTVHTGEMPLYRCTFCTKTFNSNANMYAHRKRAHPKEWEEQRQGKYSIAPEIQKIETD